MKRRDTFCVNVVTFAPTVYVVGAAKFDVRARWIWKLVSLLALSVQVNVARSWRAFPGIRTADPANPVGAAGSAGAVVPVPLTETVSNGCARSLVVMFRVADRAPAALGVKRTLIAQLAPAATVVPQPDWAAKLLGFVPTTVRPNVNGALPVLDSVTVLGALVVLIC